MSEFSEAQLIERCKHNDEVAFTLLIELYQQKIYNTALRMMGNYHDAADCAQEVFLRIFRSLKNFRGDSSFSTWVYHITVNVCRDELRSRAKHNEDSIDELFSTEKGELKKEFASDDPLVEELYESKALSQGLQLLINELEPDYRIILIMREHDELAYQEIADILNVSIGTVKSRINRARSALKKRILEDGKLFSYLDSLYSIENKGKRGAD